MDRENALAATWAATYSILLVLTSELFEHLGIAAFYTVPFVVIVLPVVVAVMLLPFRGGSPGKRP